MTDAILIVGGGIAGLTAAEVCAAAGARAIVAESDAIVGGRLAAAMTDGSPGDVDGVAVPTFDALEQSGSIELITLASIERCTGGPGNFDVEISERARFVTDECTRCNRCRPVCPAVGTNEYDAGLTFRKAIFTPLPQTLPQAYAIDIERCLNSPPNYLPCNRCIEVCDDDAIHFDLPLERRRQCKVGAVVVAIGSSPVMDARLGEYGYGAHPDVVTSVELSRMLLSPGPTGGYAARPSNEDYPHSVLLIVDDLTPASVYTAVTQIRRLAAQDIDRIRLLVTTQPADDRLPELPRGVEVAWGLVQKIEPAESGDGITVSYADLSSSRIPADDYDLVVLGVDERPPDSLAALAATLGLALDEAGFVALTDSQDVCATNRPGIYAAGAIGGPVTLPRAIEQARTAALAALGDLDPRVLSTGGAAGDAASAAVLSDDEMRARIERALSELLRRAD